VVHVGVQVDVCGRELLVPEPERDDGDVGAGVEEAHGGGVPEGVHGDVLAAQRSTADARGVEVAGQAELDGVVAEACPGAGREQRIAGLTAALFQPFP
jgi:hypothetical protein